MTSVRFNLKNRKERKTLILLKFRYIRGAKLPFTYSTSIKVSPAHWDDRKQRSKTGLKHKQGIEINKILDLIEDETLNLYHSRLSELKRLTYPELKQHLDIIMQKTVIDQVTIWTIIDQSILDLSHNALRQRQAKKVLKHLIAMKGRVGHFEADGINYKWFKSFLEYSKECDHKTSYTQKLWKQIKVYLNEADKLGLLRNQTFKTFKIDDPTKNARKKEDVYLTFEELTHFAHYKLSTRLAKIRDVWIVQACLAYSYKELKEISEGLKDRIKYYFDDNGNTIMTIPSHRGKTLVTQEKPIHPLAAAILKRYRFKLPFVADAVYNRYIKEAAKDAGFDDMVEYVTDKGGKIEIHQKPKYKLITNYTARRTGITIWTKKIGLDNATAIGGHTSKIMTKIYDKETASEKAVRIAKESGWFN